MPSDRPDPVDPVALTQALVRCPSVTPEEGGALRLLADLLGAHGFACRRADRDGVPNLIARKGSAGAARVFGFNGHTDVVPPGPRDAWSRDPFGGEIADGKVWGRGASDMKSGVAAFVAAACAAALPPDGAILLTVTGDEEGPSEHGTRAILDAMAAAGERMDACLVGEPTGVGTVADTIKIGRRGSLTAAVTVTGVQGHAAYPHRARNPVAALARLIDRLASEPMDQGTAHFDASTVAPVSMDVGNAASNVIPQAARGVLNIRFNDAHSGASVTERLRAAGDAVARDFGVTVAWDIHVSGESFLTPPGPLSDLVARAVEAETGRAPALSTSGGTSDARFVRTHCPVVELGLAAPSMHQVDEHAEVAQIGSLTRIYARILKDWFT